MRSRAIDIFLLLTPWQTDGSGDKLLKVPLRSRIYHPRSHQSQLDILLSSSRGIGTPRRHTSRSIERDDSASKMFAKRDINIRRSASRPALGSLFIKSSFYRILLLLIAAFHLPPDLPVRSARFPTADTKFIRRGRLEQRVYGLSFAGQVDTVTDVVGEQVHTTRQIVLGPRVAAGSAACFVHLDSTPSATCITLTTPHLPRAVFARPARIADELPFVPGRTRGAVPVWGIHIAVRSRRDDVERKSLLTGDGTRMSTWAALRRRIPHAMRRPASPRGVSNIIPSLSSPLVSSFQRTRALHRPFSSRDSFQALRRCLAVRQACKWLWR
ncbi:uncharacterized protein SCHCODRAFT_01177145 [Schizophyllum commune H4-8]|nr:uncharacterized protein SCHCODRAFT_01177145 [Schizophyllum commune H4-8]KAI5897244.1 hypothetical protein SCHCODRAFT_01177145 [Schizophyllum commune H4-8]